MRSSSSRSLKLPRSTSTTARTVSVPSLETVTRTSSRVRRSQAGSTVAAARRSRILFMSVPRDRRIDGTRPGVDAARQGEDFRQAVLFEESGDHHAADAAVAVDHDLAALRRLEVGHPLLD